MGDALPFVNLGSGRQVTSVSAGTEHKCATLDNGQVKCWGYGLMGRLGLGDEARRGASAGGMGDALPSVALGAGAQAIAVAAADQHTCKDFADVPSVVASDAPAITSRNANMAGLGQG
jgi:hypothetical protein